MFTRCPGCRAAFSITQQQLEIAAGVVRCGICEHVFDARLFLFNQWLESGSTTLQDMHEIAPVLSTESTPPATDTTPFETTHIDLESLDRELHDQQTATPTQAIDDATPAESAQTTALQQEADDYGASSEPLVDSIPKVIADQVSQLDEDAAPIKLPRWLGLIVPVALIALLVLQASAAFTLDLLPTAQRDSLCKWLICNIETPRALSKITVLNRNIFTHPSEPEALMVTLTLINHAGIAQPYPIIQLRFLNTAGEVIAARQFSANHYLRNEWQPHRLMPAAKPLSIQLEVHDVGEEVVSYDFDFL